MTDRQCAVVAVGGTGDKEGEANREGEQPWAGLAGDRARLI